MIIIRCEDRGCTSGVLEFKLGLRAVLRLCRGLFFDNIIVHL